MRRIGIDFDNTVVCYDKVFARTARERGWFLSGGDTTKSEIRDSIRRLATGEEKWQWLQAAAYGPRIVEAELFPGVTEFLSMCRGREWAVFIVSHKTEYASSGDRTIRLTDAAREWLRAQGLTSGATPLVRADHIYFEGSRAAKIARIRSLKCTDFIDDLVEVFDHPDFPEDTRPIHFVREQGAPTSTVQHSVSCADWKAIADLFDARVQPLESVSIHGR